MVPKQNSSIIISAHASGIARRSRARMYRKAQYATDSAINA